MRRRKSARSGRTSAGLRSQDFGVVDGVGFMCSSWRRPRACDQYEDWNGIFDFLEESRRTMEWLNYHHLRYFWTVANLGSLRKASEKLRVSQPSISAQLRSLQQALGEKLFQRRGRNLVLTEMGQLVHGYAEAIFSLGRKCSAASKASGEPADAVECRHHRRRTRSWWRGKFCARLSITNRRCRLSVTKTASAT